MDKKVAKDLQFFKLFWVFMFAAFFGSLIQIIFNSVLQRRFVVCSGVVYGWFSVFWGLGAVIVTIFFHKMKENRDFILIILGTVVCGIYQYLFHMMEEHIFGMRFDTVSQFDVLNGRVDMLFCIIGGVLVMFWIKDIYPVFSSIIERVPTVMRNIVSIIVVLLMAANLVISAMALRMMGERYMNLAPQSPLDIFLDLQYSNEFLEARLPNIRSVEVPTWMEQLPIDWNKIKEENEAPIETPQISIPETAAIQQPTT